MSQREIELGPTQSKFVLSNAPVVVLIGPQGEGKTFAAVAAIMRLAQMFEKKIRGAIIRDRFTVIKANTVPSINRVVGDLVTFHDDMKLLKSPWCEIDLFGVEDFADINRLQGSEYYFKWIEEPAPYFDQGSVGIREEVFDICYSRGGREQGAINKVFVTMNPASKAHWTHKRFILNPQSDFDVFRIPYGENKYLPQEERERTKKAYKDRPEFLARYVKGEFASIHLGEAVVPEFSELWHRSLYPLVPLETLTFRLWDGGLHPACVFAQVTPGGQIWILGTVRDENIGMKQLINDYVRPLMATKYHKVPEWRDIGDAHLRDPDYSDSTKSAAEVVEKELKTYFEDGEMSWERRRETIKEGFLMNVEANRPKIIVSCDDDIMTEALGGGWHYPKNSAGVIGEKPVKDKHSHPGDALSHGLAAILHPGEGRDKPRVERYDTVYDPFVEDRPRVYAEPRLTEWSPFDEERR